MGRAELLKYQHSCIILIISDNTWRGGDVECVCVCVCGGGGGGREVCVGCVWEVKEMNLKQS